VVLPRLACVRRAASVRPEPGSNSPLEIAIARSVEEFASKVQEQLVRTVKYVFAARNQLYEPPSHFGRLEAPSQRRGACALAFDTLCSFQGAGCAPRRVPARGRSAGFCPPGWSRVGFRLRAVRPGGPGRRRCGLLPFRLTPARSPSVSLGGVAVNFRSAPPPQIQRQACGDHICWPGVCDPVRRACRPGRGPAPAPLPRPAGRCRGRRGRR
jgi:hypothetical protein